MLVNKKVFSVFVLQAFFTNSFVLAESGSGGVTQGGGDFISFESLAPKRLTIRQAIDSFERCSIDGTKVGVKQLYGGLVEYPVFSSHREIQSTFWSGDGKYQLECQTQDSHQEFSVSSHVTTEYALNTSRPFAFASKCFFIPVVVPSYSYTTYATGKIELEDKEGVHELTWDELKTYIATKIEAPLKLQLNFSQLDTVFEWQKYLETLAWAQGGLLRRAQSFDAIESMLYAEVTSESEAFRKLLSASVTQDGGCVPENYQKAEKRYLKWKVAPGSEFYMNFVWPYRTADGEHAADVSAKLKQIRYPTERLYRQTSAMCGDKDNAQSSTDKPTPLKLERQGKQHRVK